MEGPANYNSGVDRKAGANETAANVFVALVLREVVEEPLNKEQPSKGKAEEGGTRDNRKKKESYKYAHKALGRTELVALHLGHI